MNQLSKEIEQLIHEEAVNWGEKEGGDDHYRDGNEIGYEIGATKWALMMEEFAEWCAEMYYEFNAKGKWLEVDGKTEFTTSQLLTLFLKQTKNS